jgi:transposase
MSGSFNQDAQGHWYINVTIEMRVATEAPNTRVGIDLGLESVITLSQPLADGGQKIEPPKFYRESEETLAITTGEEDAEAHPQDRKTAERTGSTRLRRSRRNSGSSPLTM